MSLGAFSTCWIDSENRNLLGTIAPGVFENPVDPVLLDDYLTSPDNWLGVAIAGDLVVGMCKAAVLRHPDRPTEIYLDQIRSGDDWRRQGIADQLICALCSRADRVGIGEIWVATDIDNHPAQALYEKTGARPSQAVYYYLEW